MIVHRRIDFSFDPDVCPHAGYGGDIHLTTFWEALSLLFPEGERFFIESVRHYRDRIKDPQLLEDIEAFIGQEAMHGKGHRAFNEMVHAHVGETSVAMEKQIRRLLDFGRRTLSHRQQLAVTCALEHFTAMLAEQLLEREEHRMAAHESIRNLWVWHALEESEHKAVAFDVYETIDGSYSRRIAMMLLASAFFFAETAYVHTNLLAARKELFKPKGWAKAIGYFWVRPGFLRQLVPAYLDYFRPGFHPNDRDKSALLEEWREKLFGPAGELRGQLKKAA